MSKKTDYVIIGGGLAGSILAYKLIKADKNVVLIDSFSQNECSSVAAGIYNPITGRSHVKTSWADEIFTELHTFYNFLEAELKVNFFHPMPIVVPIANAGEENAWVSRSFDSGYENYFTISKQKSIFSEYPFHVQIKKSGFVDVPLIISSLRNYISKNAQLINKWVDLDNNLENIESLDSAFNLKFNTHTKIIFCRGYYSKENCPFSYLPFRPVKGEIIEIKTQDIPEQQIYNISGIFVLPIGNQIFKIGSNYQHDYKDALPSLEIKKHLCEKIEKIIPNINYEIVSHKAGIRPATILRKPFIGIHKNIRNAYIFNGLGSKGVSLAPFFGENLAQHLLFNKPLFADLDSTF